ncbi:hypothetical protein CN579_29375, partial [Bacillus toyonensis]
IWKKKNKSSHFVWHLDETYIKVKGEWRYLVLVQKNENIKKSERFLAELNLMLLNRKDYL